MRSSGVFDANACLKPIPEGSKNDEKGKGGRIDSVQMTESILQTEEESRNARSARAGASWLPSPFPLFFH
jgi:hypothetical protein